MLTKNSSFKKERPRDIDVVRVMLVKDVNSPYRIKSIKKSDDVASVARSFLANEDREVFIAINLDGSNKINSIHVVAIGSVNAALVHPREIFKVAILSNASGIVLAHNHPSGNPEPSDEDRQITSKLIEAGNLLGIKFLDHVIVGDSQYSYLTEYKDRDAKKLLWDTSNFKNSQADQAESPKKTASESTEKSRQKGDVKMSEEIIAYRVGDHLLCPKDYQMSVKILKVHDIELPAQPVKEGEVENFVCEQCENMPEERGVAAPLLRKRMIEPRRRTLSKREKINLVTLEDILVDSGNKLSFVSDFLVPQDSDSFPEFSNDGFGGLLIILDEIKDDIDFVLDQISERKQKGLIIEKTE